jgi:hypothetical protein
MRSAPYARPKVPVSSDDYLLVRDEPELLNLDRDSSEAARFQELLHEGIQARRELVRRTERLANYTAWADDPENRAAVAAARADTREHGGALGGFRRPRA